MNKKLYIVDWPRKTEWAEAAPIDVEYDYERIEKCPHCGEVVSGAYWMPPREVVLTKRKCPDFLYSYSGGTPFVISENAVNKIQQAGLTGIICTDKIEKARFQRKAKVDVFLPNYYYVELKRSRITIDHTHSKIEYGFGSDRKGCPLCRQVPATYDFFRSLSFHMDDYEGYDIFHIYELGDTVFLSQRFVDFYKESGLTNLHFGPAEKHGRWMAEYFLDGNEDA